MKGAFLVQGILPGALQYLYLVICINTDYPNVRERRLKSKSGDHSKSSSRRGSREHRSQGFVLRDLIHEHRSTHSCLHAFIGRCYLSSLEFFGHCYITSSAALLLAQIPFQLKILMRPLQTTTFYAGLRMTPWHHHSVLSRKPTGCHQHQPLRAFPTL
jgi:hypothetical protein